MDTEANLEKKNIDFNKTEEKYYKLIGYCLTNFKEKLRLMKYAYENNTLKIIIEVIKNNRQEFIVLKNASVFNNQELMDQIIKKFKNILKSNE